MNRAEAIREAESIMRQRREQAVSEAEARRAELFSGDAEVAALYERMNAVHYDAFIAGLKDMANAANLMSAAKVQYDNLNKRMGQLLKARGHQPDVLWPRFNCLVCEDKGIVDTPQPGYCACFERLADDLTDGSLSSLEGSFEAFDLGVYNNTTPIRGNVTQRGLMQGAKVVCEQYANTYPHGKLNLSLSGRVGLGKTYLYNCVVKRLDERGIRVLKTSAFAMQRAMRDYHFGEGSDAFDRMLDAPVLAIDDLGSEPLMRNITVEYLFNLINERHIARLGTIITTNLNPTEFKQNYNERIFSRLFNPGENILVELIGEDIRIRQPKQG